MLQHQRPYLEQAAEEGVGLRPRAAQHQLGDARRMVGGDHLAHGAAGRMADVVRAGDTQRVHQLHGVIGHLPDGIVDARQRAAAGAAMIVQDDGEVPRESRDMRLPEARDAAEPRHQQQRRSAAVGFVVQRRAVAEGDVGHGLFHTFPRLAGKVARSAGWGCARERTCARRHPHPPFGHLPPPG